MIFYEYHYNPLFILSYSFCCLWSRYKQKLYPLFVKLSLFLESLLVEFKPVSLLIPISCFFPTRAIFPNFFIFSSLNLGLSIVRMLLKAVNRGEVLLVTEIGGDLGCLNCSTSGENNRAFTDRLSLSLDLDFLDILWSTSSKS